MSIGLTMKLSGNVVLNFHHRGFKSLLNITSLSHLHVLISCHLSKIYLQSEIKHGFIWPKTLNFLFQKLSNFYSEKMSCSLKVFFP